MTYVVIEGCIKCNYQDCVEVCPVDCFYEGDEFLVIDPEECIDCAVCEPECPADAIVADGNPVAAEWIEINARFAAIWPNITAKGAVPPDADDWRDVPDKRRFLEPQAAE